MKSNYIPGQHVYFIISGRIIKEAVIVKSSPWFVTIMFKKKEDSVIRLPHSRLFVTKEEALQHIRPVLTPRPEPLIKEENGEYTCTRRWDLWE